MFFLPRGSSKLVRIRQGFFTTVFPFIISIYLRVFSSSSLRELTVLISDDGYWNSYVKDVIFLRRIERRL